MSLRNKNGLAVLLRVVLLFCSFYTMRAIFTDYFSSDAGASMLYYYNLSNLCMVLISLAYLGFGFRTRITGSTRIPRAMQIIRYTVAVSAAVTLLQYWISVLCAGDTFTLQLLYPFLIHTLVPILFITDFLAFDRGEPIGRAGALTAAALPLLFAFYTLFYVALDAAPIYVYDQPYLYFFTDFNAMGYTDPVTGLGIALPVALLFGATLAIGYLYRLIQLKTMKPGQPE